MTLVANWRRVLRHAWSVHLSVAACAMAVCAGLDTAWPLLGGLLPISPIVFAVLGGVFSCAAVVSRVIYQDSVHEN